MVVVMVVVMVMVVVVMVVMLVVVVMVFIVVMVVVVFTVVTIIMVLVGKQLELLELKAKRHSQGCSISKIGFVYCQRTHVASKLIR